MPKFILCQSFFGPKILSPIGKTEKSKSNRNEPKLKTEKGKTIGLTPYLKQPQTVLTKSGIMSINKINSFFSGPESCGAKIRELREDVAPHPYPNVGLVIIVPSYNARLFWSEGVHLRPGHNPASNNDIRLCFRL